LQTISSSEILEVAHGNPTMVFLFPLTFRSSHQPTGRLGRRFSRPLRVEVLEDRTLLSVAPFGPQVRINSFTDGDQITFIDDRQTIATGPSGSVVVWNSHDQDGDGTGIFAQRLDSLGQPLGDEFQVNSFTPDFQYNPGVAMAGDGRFVVVWVSFGQDGDSNGIFARLFAADGTPLGDDFQVNASSLDSQESPSIAMTTQGDFVITWSSFLQDGDGYGVFARQFDASGTPRQIEEFQVSTTTLGNQQMSEAALDAAGNFVIVWQSEGVFPEGSDGDNFGIFARRFQADGNAMGPEFQVNTYAPDSQDGPAVAMNPAGQFVVAWASFGQDQNDYGVFAQRFAPDGSPRGQEFQVNNNTFSFQGYPALALDREGHFIVTWSSFDQDGSGYGVYARRFTSDGVPLADEFLVPTETLGDQFDSSVALDAAGNYQIVWSGNGSEESLSTDVFLRRSAVFPEVLEDTQAAPLVLSGAGSGSQSGTIDNPGDVDLFRFVAPLSGFVIAWQLTSGDSALINRVSAFSAEGQDIIFTQVGGGTENCSGILFPVTAGQSYYLLAADAFGENTGPYELTLSTWTGNETDLTNDFPDFPTLELSSCSSALVAGSLESPLDGDMFRFVARETGRLQIDQRAFDDKTPLVAFTVFDGNQRLVQRSEEGFDNLFVPVVAGRTYFVLVTALDQGTGNYFLVFNLPFPGVFVDPGAPPAQPGQGPLPFFLTPSEARVDLLSLNGSTLAIIALLVNLPTDSKAPPGTITSPAEPGPLTSFIFGLSLTSPVGRERAPERNLDYGTDPIFPLNRFLGETFQVGQALVQTQVHLFQPWLSRMESALQPVGDYLGQFLNQNSSPGGQGNPPQEEESEPLDSSLPDQVAPDSACRFPRLASLAALFSFMALAPLPKENRKPKFWHF
jgi:hypothetical protein